MALYYTHLDNHTGFSRDETGKDFPSDDGALREAALTAAAVLGDDLAAGRSPLTILLIVEREDGSPVATMDVSARIDRPA